VGRFASRYRGVPSIRVTLIRALVRVWAAVGVWTLAVAVVPAAAPAASAKKPTAANWDGSEQRLVVRDAVMSDTAGTFAGAAPLSAAAESAALAAIAGRESVAPVAFDAGAPLTVVRFDALLVDQLGLGDVAQHVQQVAAAAGLAPPAYFGTEVVSRYLGLRYEQPVGSQTLDLYPWQPITRAEAAHSFAVVLGIVGDAAAQPPPAPAGEGGQAGQAAPASESGQAGQTAPAGAGGPAGESGPTGAGGPAGEGGPTGAGGPAGESGPTDEGGSAGEGSPQVPSEGQARTPPHPESWALANAREALMAFSLPAYNAAQREVLRIAVSKIGMPYVWGGTTDNTADGLEHGGYDCSGFAWRVYKVSGLSWGKQILGRTAAEQAGEIPRRRRLHLPEVAGGDLLFFGSARFSATATNANVIHEAIALSSRWAINSSGQGVYVLPLTSGWLHESFTWGRRVL
jgi:cell wall-associated NlpC family hydrolase